MAENDVSVEVKDAAVIGAIEIMISPEYNSDWIRELTGITVDKEKVTEELIDSVDDLLTEKLRGIARGLVGELSEERQKDYAYLMKKAKL